MSKKNEASPSGTGPENKQMEDTEQKISTKRAIEHDWGSGLWSDGFVRSFVNQKGDSLWTLTVTTPDRGGSAPSK